MYEYTCPVELFLWYNELFLVMLLHQRNACNELFYSQVLYSNDCIRLYFERTSRSVLSGTYYIYRTIDVSRTQHYWLQTKLLTFSTYNHAHLFIFYIEQICLLISLLHVEHRHYQQIVNRIIFIIMFRIKIHTRHTTFQKVQTGITILVVVYDNFAVIWHSKTVPATFTREIYCS